MLESNLKNISDCLKQWEAFPSREAVLTECIRQKLHVATLNYEDELKIGKMYLEAAYKAINVMKAAQKIQRRDDIERLEAQLEMDSENEDEEYEDRLN